MTLADGLLLFIIGMSITILGFMIAWKVAMKNFKQKIKEEKSKEKNALDDYLKENENKILSKH